MNNLNRFTKKTKEVLSKRAGLLCSNPDCGVKTVGPHIDEDKVLSVGEAAHIRGANVGSARYDASMSSNERKLVTNGIWLCRKCAKIIDSEPSVYTTDILYEWKREHEDQVRRDVGFQPTEKIYRERIMRLFAGEPLAVLQIVLDKPENWEHFLVVELLRDRV